MLALDLRARRLFETRAAPGSMGLFLSLATLPGCTLIIKELFFFESRLCLTLLPHVLVEPPMLPHHYKGFPGD